MPQASTETLNVWLEFAKEKLEGDHLALCDLALHTMKENFLLRSNGVFRKVIPGHHFSSEESAALQYLIEEWDYGYEEINK